MDWKSHPIDALLEHALVEDKAASDATTNLTIDPNLRASASIIAKQEMVVAGLGHTRLEVVLEARWLTQPTGAMVVRRARLLIKHKRQEPKPATLTVALLQTPPRTPEVEVGAEVVVPLVERAATERTVDRDLSSSPSGGRNLT